MPSQCFHSNLAHVIPDVKSGPTPAKMVGDFPDFTTTPPAFDPRNNMRSVITAMQRVPTTRQVIPGAAVNIVLKVDQPTGRTVSGVVKDVLTRGNHPRGIKVRLTDGRIGRVQTMATANQNAEPAGASEEVRAEGQSQPKWRRHTRQSPELPSSSVGLDAYIKPAKQRRPRKGQASATDSSHNSVPSDTPAANAQPVSTCPVCGVFEGDAAAVSHHVASHFDS